MVHEGRVVASQGYDLGGRGMTNFYSFSAMAVENTKTIWYWVLLWPFIASLQPIKPIMTALMAMGSTPPPSA